MAEPLRNEVAITIAGEERTMRATFSAIRSIEQSLGMSIIKLIGKVANRDLGMGETAIIIDNGLRGYMDTRLTLQEVGDALMETGLTSVLMPVMEFICKSMDGVKVGKPEPEVLH